MTKKKEESSLSLPSEDPKLIVQASSYNPPKSDTYRPDNYRPHVDSFRASDKHRVRIGHGAIIAIVLVVLIVDVALIIATIGLVSPVIVIPIILVITTVFLYWLVIQNFW